MIDLSIIIVNYNVKEFLLNSLDSIRKAAGKIQLEIIVVDNASDDGSVEALREKYPDVILIDNKKNIGFGRANNQALEIAKGKYFLLLNPDTILREDTLKKMIEFFETHPDAGIAGCKVLNPDGSLQLACRRGFPGPWTSFTKVMGLSTLFPKSRLFAKYNLTYLDENQTYEVDAVSGAFMMMRKESYEKVGGFDKEFFMYGEDLDLCYRTQKAGFKVYYYHETEIIHYKGESTKRSRIDETTVFYDAMQLFVKKHFSSSFIVESILQLAIIARKFLAFANVFKVAILGIILDFIFLSGSVFVGEKLYSNVHWRGFPDYALPWVYFVPAILQLIISGLVGAYKKKSLSVLKIIISLFYGFIILSTVTFFFKQFAFSRAVVLLTYLVAVFVLLLWRILVKVFFRLGLSDSKKARTLIVGFDLKTNDLAAKLKSHFTSLYQVVGLIGFTRKDIGEKIGAHKILGTLDNLKKVIVDEKIEKVIFSSEKISFDQMFAVVSECQGLNVDFMVAGKELDYLVGKSSITMLDDIALLKVQYNISDFSYKIIKQIFDFVLSIILILLCLYPLIYLISKFTSKKSDVKKFILDLPKVLIGEKSFVGPCVSSYYGELYVGKIGLTGLWSVENLSRDDEEEMKSLDLFYAKNQSIWLDLEILGRTISKMLFNTEK
jgi:O-antigen biosynthesis protein